MIPTHQNVQLSSSLQYVGGWQMHPQAPPIFCDLGYPPTIYTPSSDGTGVDIAREAPEDLKDEDYNTLHATQLTQDIYSMAIVAAAGESISTQQYSLAEKSVIHFLGILTFVLQVFSETFMHPEYER
jgi:hypothetical protein